MIFWSWAFNADARFAPNTAKSAEWNRGAYIAEALAHCGECHTPRNLAFALDNWRKVRRRRLTAGWRAYNITSDKGTGVGAWSDEDVFAYLAEGSRRGTRHGVRTDGRGGRSQLQPDWLPADVRALVTYLRSIPAVASAEPATIAPPAPESPKEGRAAANALGKKVFEQACVSCHSWTGVSAMSPFATISGSRAVNDPTCDQCRADRHFWHTPLHAGRDFDARLWQHLFGRRDRGGRQLRHRPIWQRGVEAHGEGRGGAAGPDVTLSIGT